MDQSSAAYAENRARFLAMMQEGSALFLFAGSAPAKRGDAFYPFTPQRNFLYLTGLGAPNLILFMEKKEGQGTATLFTERRSERGALWVGEVLSHGEAEAVSGIGRLMYIDEFTAFAEDALFKNRYAAAYLDLENRSLDAPPTPDVAFAAKLRGRFPALRVEDARGLFGPLRLIKSPWEVERIKKAIACTAEGFALMMRHAAPGMHENEVEAYFDFALKKNGARHGFGTIAASGGNATVLHYVKNRAKTRDGDLILVDAGAEWEYYSADVTRTFPMNGRFTDRQRELYGIVLEANRKVIEAVRPRCPFSRLNEIAKEHYASELKRIGLIEDAGGVQKHYYHSVSHMLGLETHDIGQDDAKELAPGMVLTVEPGLYVAEEGIGIRIEDDVLVTDAGCEVLSSAIPKDPEDIERAMAKAGAAQGLGARG